MRRNTAGDDKRWRNPFGSRSKNAASSQDRRSEIADRGSRIAESCVRLKVIRSEESEMSGAEMRCAEMSLP